jgi:hypothetical protein
MSDPERSRRSPFALNRDFLVTPFERRFQGWLRHAWQNRSWHVIAAVPGSGKSSGIHDLVLHSGASKEATGVTRLPVLAVRSPKYDAREQGLVTALASSFGVLPTMSAAFRRIWLVQMMASAQVECLIIDDVICQRSWPKWTRYDSKVRWTTYGSISCCGPLYSTFWPE